MDPSVRPSRTKKRPKRFADVMPDATPSSWVEPAEDDDAVAEVSLARSEEPRKRSRQPSPTVTKILGGSGSLRLLAGFTRITLQALPNLDETHVSFVLAEKGAVTFVAHLDKDVVGGACARRAHRTLFQLSFIGVDPVCRGRGLGAKLVRRVLLHARQYRVHLVAAYADKSAVAFFERYGFKEVDDLDGDLATYLDKYTTSSLVIANVHDALEALQRTSPSL